MESNKSYYVILDYGDNVVAVVSCTSVKEFIEKSTIAVAEYECASKEDVKYIPVQKIEDLNYLMCNPSITFHINSDFDDSVTEAEYYTTKTEIY